MIIKKPYAFLIKNFRIIHLILSVLLLFLVGKTHSIFKFFNDYVKNGFYAYSNNISSKYINFYMFIAVIFIIVLASFVYLLMKWKKKSRVFYISICVFYFLLFIGYLVYFNLFNTILNTSLDVRAVRAYRDIIVILYILQYFFLIYSIVRAIGFDIKKFDFKKDLEELDIAEEDQEEIEVTFGQNAYKYKRKVRRIVRESKYYILENKFFFGVICGVASLVLIFFIYVNVSVYSKKFNESEFFNVNGVIFRVLDSYVSDLDLRGNPIIDNKKYVAVKVSMENTNTGRVNLSTDSLRLMLDDEYYYPIYSKSDYFRDLGEGYYKSTTLYPGESYEFLIIYEVPRELSYETAVFRMVDSVNLLHGEISAKYKDVSLQLESFMELQEPSYYFVGNAISLEESTLRNSEIVFNSYELGESFKESYKYCVAGNCYDTYKTIEADTLGRFERIIMKLNLEIDIDEDLYINKYLTNNSSFISTFGSVTYVIGGVEKKATINVKSLENIETDNVYIEVPAEIRNANLINLKLNIRNCEYIISL